jgi:hypothetical protein
LPLISRLPLPPAPPIHSPNLSSLSDPDYQPEPSISLVFRPEDPRFHIGQNR